MRIWDYYRQNIKRLTPAAPLGQDSLGIVFLLCSSSKRGISLRNMAIIVCCTNTEEHMHEEGLEKHAQTMVTGCYFNT